MAGHSKFKNIMHRKGRADAVRSKLFSKLSREITVAAKAGLPDPAMNARGSIGLAALHFHTQGALLVLNDGERAHTYFQLLFQLLERRFIILKLNSHFVSD